MIGKRIPALCIFVFFYASSPLLAENLIAIGFGEGDRGTLNVPIPVTARCDQPIHGFSLAISYPRKSLRLLEISQRGTSTEAIGAEFFQSILQDSDGTGTLGAIFSYNEPYSLSELPATPAGSLPHLLAWLIFSALPDVTPGEYAIDLIDGIGDPPISNRFTSRGITIRPALKSGTFLIHNDNILTLEWKYGIPGFRIPPLYAFARHPKILAGFQIAISFDPRALTLEEATFAGTTMVQALGGADKIEFVSIKWLAAEIAVSPTESRTTAGIIFDYVPPYTPGQALPAETTSTTRQSIMRYSFQPKEGADQFGEYVPLALTDSAAPDAVNNVFISDTASMLPQKVNGRIYFSTGGLTGKIVSFKDGLPVSGASLVLDPGGFSTASKADGTFSFYNVQTDLPPPSVPPGPYTLLVTKLGFYPGRFAVEVTGKGETTEAGNLTIFPVPSSQGGFLRGRINPDDDMDISDSIYLLSALFLGGDMPTCLDAADANDDGHVDISDCITLLSYIVAGGKAPPPPFSSCGQDPTTGDSLDCKETAACK